MAKNRVSVRRETSVGRGIGYFDISGNSNIRITFFHEKLFYWGRKITKDTLR
jgi:hypothetical protein